MMIDFIFQSFPELAAIAAVFTAFFALLRLDRAAEQEYEAVERELNALRSSRALLIATSRDAAFQTGDLRS
jgi:hypothetical protein